MGPYSTLFLRAQPDFLLHPMPFSVAEKAMGREHRFSRLCVGHCGVTLFFIPSAFICYCQETSLHPFLLQSYCDYPWPSTDHHNCIVRSCSAPPHPTCNPFAHACCRAAEKEMATHSSVLAWRIPGTEEPVGLLSMGSHRIGHDLMRLSSSNVYTHASFPSLFLLSESSHLGFLPSWLLPIHQPPSHRCPSWALVHADLELWWPHSGLVPLTPWSFISDSFLLRFFTCGPFLKSLLNLLQYCFFFFAS